MPNALDFSGTPWGAYDPIRKRSYVISRIVQPDPAFSPDPANPEQALPTTTVYPLDRLATNGSQTRLGVYSSLAEAQAEAQSDANT